LQDEDEQVEQERDRLTEAVEQDMSRLRVWGNYDIYRRNDSAPEQDTDEDK